MGVRGSGDWSLTLTIATAAEAGRLHPLYLSPTEDRAPYIHPNPAGILEIHTPHSTPPHPRRRYSNPLPTVTEALLVPTQRGHLRVPLPVKLRMRFPGISSDPMAYVPPHLQPLHPSHHVGTPSLSTLKCRNIPSKFRVSPHWPREKRKPYKP